jgi:WD40 repeat protein
MGNESGHILGMKEQSIAWTSQVRLPITSNTNFLIHIACFAHVFLLKSSWYHPVGTAGDSKWLLTAGADSSVRLWDVELGKELCVWRTGQPAKACAFAQADQRLAAFTTSAFSTAMPSIRFVRIADVPGESDENPILQIDLERTQTCALKALLSLLLQVALLDLNTGSCRVSRLLFTDQDTVIVTVGEDGFARRYDVKSGKLLAEEQIHTEMITDMQARAI